jgi:hypothetical protein
MSHHPFFSMGSRQYCTHMLFQIKSRTRPAPFSRSLTFSHTLSLLLACSLSFPLFGLDRCEECERSFSRAHRHDDFTHSLYRLDVAAFFDTTAGFVKKKRVISFFVTVFTGYHVLYIDRIVAACFSRSQKNRTDICTSSYTSLFVLSLARCRIQFQRRKGQK